MTDKPDILLMAGTRPDQIAQLEQRFTLHRYHDADAAERTAMLDQFGARIRGIVASGPTTITADLLDRLPALEIVSSNSAGYDRMDAPALKAKGVILTNASVALSDDVANAGIMLMMAARADLIRQDAFVRDGAWANGEFPLTHSLTGARLGIVGMGQIGQAILERATALKMDIAYHTRSEKPCVGARYEPDLVALADWAQILMVIVPGGKATEHLINADVLRALGPDGTLVNIARGSVVDEAALIAALRDGTLGSAALDVFANEPKPNPDLTSLLNVTLAPHHASGTFEAREAMAQTMVDNLIAHFDGKPVLTPVAL
ncbi:MAG: dihydrofolate reductase [Paracoccus denitrificans]|nr:MAG: dihydrofolate reductase [Paracoccus denitrificans]PZO86340.1 MAG: dihydrofolate reductase [Paracoccus denitrificans]